MTRVLLAWLGNRDLSACKSAGSEDLGPTATVLHERAFDVLVLLSDHSGSDTTRYVRWIEERVHNTRVVVRPEELPSPIDYVAIHAAAVAAMNWVLEECGPAPAITINISPGTPAMHSVWVLLAKTRYGAELIEAHRESGVAQVNIPFDISAEFFPDLLRRPDQKLRRLIEGLPPEAPEFADIIRRSAAMEKAVARARRIAPRNVPVLILGESGTGKELTARAIHAASPRAVGPFEAVNCGALPRDLVESLLFGHEKGAFTGATTQHRGHFEVAYGGTLFLDEIGELSLDSQVKLLRVVQEGTVRRVGANTSTAVDVRLIAATNRDLVDDVRRRAFREDLYHRIAVGVIRLPPLREREGDIAVLIDHLLQQINREAAGQPGYIARRLSPGARNLLLRHPWPGNVRQLHNVLLRLSIWAPGAVIEEEDARIELASEMAPDASGILDLELGDSFSLDDTLNEVSRHYIKRALAQSGGNMTKAAGLVGLASYQTLANRMKRCGLR